MKKLLTTLLAASLLLSCNRTPETFLTDLQVDYMTTPLGTETLTPHFSWKMVSDRYGAHQTAWRICVVEKATGATVWDSGQESGVPGDMSVGIAYAGESLKPCTRYDWTVTVTEEAEHTLSAASWFETGLMDSGWSGAEWISSGQPHFSKYRSRFRIDFDLACQGEDPVAVFYFGRQDEKNYVQLELGAARAVISHVTEGVETKDFEGQLKALPAHVGVRVSGLDYAKGYRVWLLADGAPVNSEPVVIQPYPDDAWMPFSRLYEVGYAQRTPGCEAVFSNLTLTDEVWDTTLYASDKSVRVGGDTAEFTSPAEETGAPMLRKAFRVEKPLASARLYTTARGIYEYEVNGQRLADDWFNPGSTDYRYRILYNTYDLTPLLRQGDNVIGAMLGAGWWCDFTGYATSWQDQYGMDLALLAKVVLTYKDGTQETIVSDGSWKAFDGGPILSDSFLNGEDYDACREVPGWSTARFDDSAWHPVRIEEAPAESVTICAYTGSPIHTQQVVKAVSVSEPKPGVFVYDMGQNLVGVPRIKLRGERDDVVEFLYGEMIYPEEVPEDPLPPLTAEVYAANKGLVYHENYRGALSTDHYILKGGGTEIFQPHFTFHGFRYIEVHGLEQALPLGDVEALVLHSIGAQTSGFETSDADVNRLYENIVWGQRGNFLSIPTDCPQRDERLGWTGDAQVFVRAATYNMNVDPFFRRWFQSIRDIQGDDGSYPNIIPNVSNPPAGGGKGGGAMGWMDAGVIIPWQIYLQYGDKQFLEDQYDSMVRYMGFLQQRAYGDIQRGEGFGDWVALEHTNSPLTNTAYWAYDAMLMEKMATALGKDEDAARWHELYSRIKKAFNREFVGPDGITKETKNVPPYYEWIAGSADASFKANTQTSYVVPLQADLFDDQHKSLAVQNLVGNVAAHGYKLTTGFIGTPYLNLVLSRNGYDEVAYELFEQREFPSWLYPVLQGATTMWERWNSYTIKQGFGPVDMNSFNHYSFGSIGEWMFSYMLGIQPVEEDPGYHRFVLSPRPGGTLEYAHGHFDSVYGRIESGWKRLDGEAVQYDFTVPANTTAELELPVPDGMNVEVIKGADHVVAAASTGHYTLPAGKYRFIVR